MESIIIHPDNKEKMDAVKAFLKALKIKFETTKESPYDPDFVAKIKKSEQEARAGKLKSISLEEIWK